MRRASILLVVFLAGAWAAAGAWAQDAPPPPGSPVERESATLSGTVTGAAGRPVADVAVKIFEEGILLAEVKTGADGTYLLRFPYLPDIDWTIVVWFVPPTPDLVPEIVILRESLRAKSLDLWSTCLPRTDLRGQMHFDVQLVDDATKRQMISQLECFKRQAQ